MWSELAQDTGGIHFSHTVWKRRWNCLDIVLVTIAGADSFPWEGSELYGLGHEMITWSGVGGWKQFLLPRSSWAIKNSLTVWSFITLTCFIVSAFSKKVSFIPSDVCVCWGLCPMHQKRVLDPLELELHVVVSCLTCVLENKTWVLCKRSTRS